MAKGERAQFKSNRQGYDYSGKRRANKSFCTGPSSRAKSQPRSTKKVTNRAERRVAKQQPPEGE